MASRSRRVELSPAELRAAERYARFHWGREPDELIRGLEAPAVAPGMVLDALGPLVSVTYEARKGEHGKLYHWVHPFDDPRPLLCWTPGGRLVIVGGGYRNSDRGIVG